MAGWRASTPFPADLIAGLQVSAAVALAHRKGDAAGLRARVAVSSGLECHGIDSQKRDEGQNELHFESESGCVNLNGC